MLLNILKAKSEQDKEIDFDVEFKLQDNVFSEKNWTMLTPVHIKGKMIYQNEKLSIFAKAFLKIKALCDNCGEEFEKILAVDLNEVFIESYNSHSDEDYLINQTNVNLEKPFVDNLILNIPTRMLCKENCKGLCPYCGKNRNHMTCNCSVLEEDIDNLDNPFNKLKK